MCNTCGASCPRHVINTHIHRHTSCLCQALGHRRYNNDGNSTFTPVTVPSHRFHYRETNSIFLPHSATISMCDACGASCPMHIVNPHYVSVRHLDIADTIITVTVPSHRFHYW